MASFLRIKLTQTTVFVKYFTPNYIYINTKSYNNQLPHRFGLIDTSEQRWSNTIEKIKDLNANAAQGVSYKLVIAGRHGQGYRELTLVHMMFTSLLIRSQITWRIRSMGEKYVFHLLLLFYCNWKLIGMTALERVSFKLLTALHIISDRYRHWEKLYGDGEITWGRMYSDMLIVQVLL